MSDVVRNDLLDLDKFSRVGSIEDDESAQRVLFEEGSSNFSMASKLFNAEQKADVQTFYGVVRLVDDYIDDLTLSLEEKERLLNLFLERFNEAFESVSFQPVSKVDKLIILPFVQLMKSKNIPFEYMAAFFASMRMDLTKTDYANFEELEEYIYGSAGVIGLIMAKILNLKDDALFYAEKLGDAFQLINMSRDVGFDLDLGRIYIPLDLRLKYGFTSWNREFIQMHPIEFEKLMSEFLQIYFETQNAAAEGFKYIPFPGRLAIKLAGKIYEWTGKKILENPLSIMNTKVQPSKPRKILFGIEVLIQHYISTEG